MRKQLIYCLGFGLLSITLQAQTTNLHTGDIAIIAFQTDNNDQFAFVALVNIAAATKIQFSEKGWDGSLPIPAFAITTEGIHTWTAPAEGIARGTVIIIDFNSTGASPKANYGTVSSTSVAKFSTSGDQLIAYQGTFTAPVFIYAISSHSWLTSGTPTSTQSWLPPGLVSGISAKDFPTETDNQYFKMPLTNGSRENMLSAIGNTANWLRSNTRFTSLPAWTFSFAKDYYSKATGQITDLNSWGSESDGTGDPPLSFADSGYTYHLSNRQGTQNLNNNWVVGKLAIDSGCNLAINEFNLSVENLASNANGGRLVGSSNAQLTITGTSGAPNFDAASALLKSLTLSAGASVTLQRPLQISGGSPPGFVAIGNNAVLNSNGNLIFSSDEQGTAILKSMGSGAAITGNVQIQRFIPGGKRNFRFMGHPFSNSIGLSTITPDVDITGQGGSANGFTNTQTNNPSAFWFNPLLGDGSPNDAGWIAFTHTDGSANNAWKACQGIRILIRGKTGEGLSQGDYTPSPVLLHFTGQLNTGTQTVYLSKAASNEGFNLIANPYAASIDMSTLKIGNSITNSFYVWDSNQGTKGGYTSYPFSNATILPPFAAFFAQTSDTISGNSIQFSESSKVTGASPIQIFGSTNKPSNQLELSLESDHIFWDKQLFIFQEEASDGIDKYDARKLFNPDLSFYSWSSGKEKLSIDTRALRKESIIPLGLETELEDSFTLRAPQIPVLAGFNLFLNDKYSNKSVQIGPGFAYTFTTSKSSNTKGSERFEITAKPITNIPPMPAVTRLTSHAFPNPVSDQLLIKIASPKPMPIQIHLFNLNGQMIQTSELGLIQNCVSAISCKSLSAGIYYLSVSNGEESLVQKIIKY